VDATRHGGEHLLLWAVALATQTPGVVALLMAGFLVENSDARATRITGLSALVGLVTVIVVGTVLVPAYGGIGLLITGAFGEAVQALVIVEMIRRRAAAPIPVAEAEASVTSA